MAQQVNIPFLPGNTFTDPRKTNFSLPQTLKIKSGGVAASVDHCGIGGTQHVAKSLRNDPETDENLATAVLTDLTYSKKKLQMASIGESSEEKSVPAHIAYDKKVLSFSAFFKEAVPESPNEKFRNRLVQINYFLEDDSINVWEPRCQNSGLPQGMLYRRQKIPKPGGGITDFLTFSDFCVGGDVTIFGRTMHLYDADGFTRDFYSKKGMEMPQAEEVPQGEYQQKRSLIETPTRLATEPDPDRFQVKKFLQLDGKVLRFYCAWDNRDVVFGELRPYIVYYYLVDDSIEIREVFSPNDGRDPFPIFLRRQKLPKVFKGLASLSSGGEMFSDKDFGIGKEVTVLGRKFLIYDMDKFTRDYYSQTYGINEWPTVEVDLGQNEKNTAPQGPRESLEPKVQADPKKLENMGISIRFRAIMDSDRDTYKGREFVVAFFLADDAIAVYEKVERNSGLPGGRFLEKIKVKHPERSKTCALGDRDPNYYYNAPDFYVGGRIDVLSYRFILLDADPRTLTYMESHPTEFPMCNVDWVVEKLKVKEGESRKSVESLCKARDANASGMVTLQQFRDVIIQMNIDFTEQETMTIGRRFSYEEIGGKMNYKELCALMNKY